jgi:hypothetical protein
MSATMTLLDTLRSLARDRSAENVRSNETNEENEITPAHELQSGLNSLNSFVSSPERVADEPNAAGDLDERAAIIEFGAGVPRAWAEGYAALSAMPAPTGFSSERWRRIVDAAGTFLDRWAADAIACGWSDIDIFGCDGAAPDRRFDCMGLVLLLDRCEIVAIDGGGADLVTNTGDAQRYRRKPKPNHTVRLWDLVRSDAES